MTKVVLVVGSYADLAVPDSRERSLRLEDEIKRKEPGALVYAPGLDGSQGVTCLDIETVRAKEREMILRKFPDDVQFVDPHAVDAQELVSLAYQYGYGAKAAEAAE